MLSPVSLDGVMACATCTSMCKSQATMTACLAGAARTLTSPEPGIECSQTLLESHRAEVGVAP